MNLWVLKKIIENLYLGNKFSAPKNTEVTINCAEELFPQQAGENLDFKQIGNTCYFNFKDVPKLDEINPQLVGHCLKTIDEQLQKNKKIYVHCLWGVNRSASVVFMYLVKNYFLKAKNLDEAMTEFKKIYPPFDPNSGWQAFIKKNYPFKNL